MAEYGLVDSFHIDDGELRGVSPVDAFTLGVEWAMVREQLRRKGAPSFHCPVHEANVSRISRLVRKYGRTFKLDPVHPEWYQLDVGEGV